MNYVCLLVHLRPKITAGENVSLQIDSEALDCMHIRRCRLLASCSRTLWRATSLQDENDCMDENEEVRDMDTGLCK